MFDVLGGPKTFRWRSRFHASIIFSFLCIALKYIGVMRGHCWDRHEIVDVPGMYRAE